MKVTILTTNLSGGGAAIAAFRHYEALRKVGVEVRIIALRGISTEDAHVEILSHKPIKNLAGACARLLERADIARRLFPERLGQLWRFSSARWGIELAHHPWIKDADIVHIHWINHGLLSLSGIERILRLGKPTLWTLHDFWPITGGCHLPLLMSSCEATLCPRYGVGCGDCPLMGGAEDGESWTANQRRLKHRLIYTYPNLHFVAVSDLVARMVGAHIPGVPIVLPPPLSEELASLTYLSPAPILEEEPLRYIVVAAARLDEAVKGPALLREVIEHLVAKLSSEQLASVGLRLIGAARAPLFPTPPPIKVEYLGPQAPEDMSAYYKQARVVLSTSLFETFGQTLSEALAQGVPVVCFDMAGMAGLIRPGIDGAIIPAYDTEAMADALIPYLLSEHLDASERLERSRYFGAELSPERLAHRHLELYHRLLSLR